MTTPPFLKAGLLTVLSALLFVVVAPTFAADEEEDDEDVETVKEIPLIDSVEHFHVSWDTAIWRDSTIGKSLGAPYLAWRVGKSLVRVEFGSEQDAPKQMTFFGKGSRTWIGKRAKLRRVCERHCEDSVLTDCYWVGEYEVPGVEEPRLALAGRLALKDVKVPSFQPAPSDMPDCQDAVWGPFRTRVCQGPVVLAYDRKPLLQDFADYNEAKMIMSHVFRYGQIDYHLVEHSSKIVNIRGLLYLTPAGWVFLGRGIEPPERAEICC